MGKLRNIYLENRFFWAMGLVIVLFLIAYVMPAVYFVAIGCFLVVLVAVFFDAMVLFGAKDLVSASRTLNPQMSLGDVNPVKLTVENKTHQHFNIEVIDEFPVQLQIREKSDRFDLASNQAKTIVYNLEPKKRGEYIFGNINVFLKTRLGFLSRRRVIKENTVAKVFPSIVQMKKYELKMSSRTAAFHGIKKIRRLGQNNEFEQIKNYVQGDDYRVINWKATSRQNKLMVNQYQDERSQQVYCIIDKSRSMRMPFDGMSLLDYAINSTLTISNISMLKGDRAGIITYSDKLGARLKADRSGVHLKKIMEVLYKQKTQFNEANFELLYYGIRQNIKGRSLILLYTNFESIYAVQRVLPLLRKINQNHLLVVVFFENTEIAAAMDMECTSIKEVYFKTLAEKFMNEKQLIVSELRKYGIQTVISKPNELSVNTINKYLELKSRGMI